MISSKFALRLATALGLAIMLSGCVIVPEGGYHHHHHWYY